ncbi:MAG: PAS domain-containing sensor histidine kinase [Deltaproteobacteria bacterium]|nr:MAG: PAS domain-containing sensor histidine kinase [Deltaproteobacteria bacterium]
MVGVKDWGLGKEGDWMDATKLKVKENKGESDLRRHAEKELETMLEDTKDFSGMSPKDIASLIHELEVHQIELKMQNNELRRIQGELEKTRDKYSHLYDFAPVGYFTISAKGIIDEVNLTGASLIGIERNALIGKPFSRFVLRDDQNIFYQHRQRLLETETSQSCELRLVRNDGHKFHTCMECMVIKNTSDDLRQIRAVVSDITERKQTEKKIKEYSEKLEKQVDFLQRMEAMGTFAGGIVHDFNNLLTVIINYSNFALNGVGSESPVRENIEKIIRNAQHGASLTHWLLLFSRNQPLERKITNLNELIIDMEKMLRRIITKRINLVVLLEPDLGRVLVDPAQVELLIINLVVNARDAMPKGGKLTLETSNVELDEGYVQNHIAVIPGPYVLLAVSDTGIGMTKEVQAKLFEPFFSTKEKGQGTGLGLSTVYGIIKQSKGHIWVYSEPGKGSTFKIYLPKVKKTACIMERPGKKGESLQGSETIMHAKTLYGLMHAKKFGLEDTAVIFHPSNPFFAAPKGAHKELLNATSLLGR